MPPLKDFKKLKEIADRRDYLRVLVLTLALTLACFLFITKTSQIKTTQHDATTNKTTQDKTT